MLGPMVCAEVGVLDRTDRDRSRAEHGCCIHVAGVYVIADANDAILYVGESATCLVGRVGIHAKDHRSILDVKPGWSKELSHASLVRITPRRIVKTIESIRQDSHWKDAGSPPRWSKEFGRFLNQQSTVA